MRKDLHIQRERGAVLIVSLLFLVVLTMLGITAMSGTTFEERMAGNARDAALAHHAAEAALRRARDEILGEAAPSRNITEAHFEVPLGNGSCDKGICVSRAFEEVPGTCCAIPPAIPANVDWTNTSTMEYQDNAGKALSGVSKQPRYIMEMFCLTLLPGGGIDTVDRCRVYRFTAVGWGKNPNTRVTVEEVFIKGREDRKSF
jgi:type IV pilus assembly protein PilX